MLKIVLHQPEIPPNTGNIIRLCANTGCSLHLIEPLGFDMDDKKMRRAGLDYREFTSIALYPNFGDFCQQHTGSRVFCITTKGAQPYHEVSYKAGDAIVFGSETRGLPGEILANMPHDRKIRIPMARDSRSLNLSNATAIVTYEALRQMGFTNLA